MLTGLRAILLVLFIAAPIGKPSPEADLHRVGGGPCEASGPDAGRHLTSGQPGVVPLGAIIHR